jgi:hypothetical protein
MYLDMIYRGWREGVQEEVAGGVWWEGEVVGGRSGRR